MSNPWSQAYEELRKPYLEGKMAKKDYDGDGKIESGTDEYMGSRDKAIKKAMAEKGKKKVSEHHQKDADGNVIPHGDGTPSSVEEENIDELSKTTTANYLYQAKVDKDYVHSGKMGKYAKARDKGLKRAEKKLGPKISKTVSDHARTDSQTMRRDIDNSKFPRKYKVKEDVEQIDELSKKTLGGYIKKASKETRGNMVATQHGSGIPKRAKDIKLKQVNKRLKGMEKAGEKLAKEEVKMSRKEYAKIHKDFKSDDPKNPRTTKYVKGKGTVSMPVKFTDEFQHIEYNPLAEAILGTLHVADMAANTIAWQNRMDTNEKGERLYDFGQDVINAMAEYVDEAVELTEEFITERVDYATEYFFNEGINEEGLDIIIEELGIEDFTEFVLDGPEELYEDEAAYQKAKKKAFAGSEKRKREGKGEYSPKGSKSPYAKQGLGAKTQKKPKIKKIGDIGTRVVAATKKAKKEQPAKPISKKGLGSKIGSFVKKGIERHNKARAAGKVPEKRAREFAKGVGSGVKTAVKFAKDVKKVVSKEEVDIDEAKVDKLVPDHKRSGKRLERYGNPHGSLALGGGIQRDRRADHAERRGKKTKGMKKEDWRSDLQYIEEISPYAEPRKAAKKDEKIKEGNVKNKITINPTVTVESQQIDENPLAIGAALGIAAGGGYIANRLRQQKKKIDQGQTVSGIAGAFQKKNQTLQQLQNNSHKPEGEILSDENVIDKLKNLVKTGFKNRQKQIEKGSQTTTGAASQMLQMNSHEPEGQVVEDAKMARQSDDALSAAHKKFSSMDQTSPANKFMLKRITKEMNRRKKKVNEDLNRNQKPFYQKKYTTGGYKTVGTNKRMNSSSDRKKAGTVDSKASHRSQMKDFADAGIIKKGKSGGGLKKGLASLKKESLLDQVASAYVDEATRMKKEMGYDKGGTKKPKGPKTKDAALDAVKKSITAKYGKGAIMRSGSNQPKKVKGAKTSGVGKFKMMADKKKETAADAKKRGFKNTQDYVNTMARYGGKDNYDKGKGLGT
jgi:hypothetical protein